MVFSGKCTLFLSSLICMTLGIIKVTGANLNDACCEEIQALRQELNILRQQLERQGEEIKKLLEELPRKTDNGRDAVKRDDLSSKAKRSQFAPLVAQEMAPKSFVKDQFSTEIKPLRTNNVRVPYNVTSRPKRGFRQDKTPHIAFFADRITHGDNLGLHQTLVFGNVLTNVGNFYNRFTGIFIPNVTGFYVFHVQILTCHTGQDFRTDLVVEGVVKNSHFTGDSTHCSNGGGMAIVHVNAGDSVWVRVRTPGDYNSIAAESSIAGFLLYAS